MQRLLRRAPLAAALGLALPAVASAQRPAGGPSRSPPLSGEAAAALSAGGIVFSALVAALLIYRARAFTLSTVQYVRTDPVETGVVGFVSVVAAFVLTVLLVFTIVGAVLAVPLAVSLVLALIPGIVVAEMAVGRAVCEKLRVDRLTGSAEASLWSEFVVGVGVVTVLGAVPVLNVLAIPVVWAVAVGAVVQHVRKGEFDDSTDRDATDASDRSTVETGPFERPDDSPRGDDVEESW